MKNKIILIFIVVLLLSGCNQNPGSNKNSKEEQFVIDSNYNNYKTIVPIINSPIRGITNDYSINLDLNDMEDGLSDITKNFVDVNKEFYKPGEFITSEDAITLISREKTPDEFNQILVNNPKAKNIGLNPILKEDVNESKKYVNTIIEQNYYNLDKDGNNVMDTISIGFGINPYYLDTVIDNKELLDYANPLIANKMTKYIRSIEGLENINIVYGFYKQSNNDFYPGSYYAYGEVKSGQESFENQKVINKKYVLYPSEDGLTQDANLNGNVEKFVQNIKLYFPTSVGVTTTGEYLDNKLEELNFNIIVSNDSKLEVENFMDYISNVYNKLLDNKVKVLIEINNARGEAKGIYQIDDNGKLNKYIY